eukprot:TRINITY_DN12307_c0_g2_i1.p1 TRINITY_DN12307_c0_g2~~TRINITY_DN12307_c0_g2_i1.p1  ORF type:complete len:577 (-),score=114.13 TRINITY_DN12307_c0_g2_i1:206-1936(-)
MSVSPVSQSSMDVKVARILDGLSHQLARSQEAFLQQIQYAVHAMGVAEADHSYRSGFTENYKALFPASQRCYRVELFEACMGQVQDLMVNGTVYQLRAITLDNSVSLWLCLQQLLRMVNDWSMASPGQKPILPDLKPLLSTLDAAWAGFENHYIHDLMEIEAMAREPIVRATVLERELQALERRCEVSTKHIGAKKLEHRTARHIRLPLAQNSVKQRHLSSDGSPVAKTLLASPASQTLGDDFALHGIQFSTSDLVRFAETASNRLAHSPLRIVLQKLVEQIAIINACANVRGRGRGDLDIRVLEAAAEVFLNSEATEGLRQTRDVANSASMAAQHLLASQVLSGFLEMRSYLAEISHNLILVDAQLSNNATLVAKLTRWEESWEVGARFLLEPDLLDALSGVAGRIGRAQRFAPELVSFLENQDAELFLILPRLVLLCGFANPLFMALPASLLPHHFRGDGEQKSSTEIMNLIEEFARLHTQFSPNECAELLPRSCWQVLVQRATAGPGRAEASTDHEAAVDKFLHHLESLSMELQRHTPENWNGCCSILTHCVEAALDFARNHKATVATCTATI